MKKKITKKGIIVLAVAVFIVLITAVSVNVKGKPGPFTNAANAIAKPFRVVMSRVVGALESIYGYMYEYDVLKDENEQLKTQIAELQQNKVEYTEMSEENERLRELMGLPSRFTNYKYNTASILSWGASNWSSTFTISKGSDNSDVEVGDGVITSTGALVGQITEVYGSTSVCVSVLDTTFSASVTVGTSTDSTVASGNFALLRKQQLSIGYLADDTGIVAGDAVVTSGKGGIFPKGLVVGYVTDVAEYSTGIGKYASVSPSVELGKVTDVYVITEFEVSE